MKNGAVATMAARKAASEGFKPDRDIIFFLQRRRGDPRAWRDARRDQMAQPDDAEFGAQRRRRRLPHVRPRCRAARLGISDRREDLPDLLPYTAQSRRPQLAAAPGQCDLRARRRAEDGSSTIASSRCRTTTRAYFEERAQEEGNSHSAGDPRWLANPNDGAAADAIEANPLEVGLTRTRCVATMLNGGHADNALPQSAQATVNCRIFPGVAADGVQAELQRSVGPKVEVKPDPELHRCRRHRPRRCART